VNHRIQVIVRILASPEALQYIVREAPTASAEEAPPTRAEDIFRLSVELLGRMLVECEGLLQSRPGHESLWSLRRALCEMLLAHMVQYQCAQANTAFRNLGDQPMEPADTSKALPVTAADLKMTCANLAEALVAHNNAAQSIAAAAGDSAAVHVLRCLHQLIEYELRLVGVCSDETCAAWDGAMQSLLAARYAAFLLSRVKHYTCSGVGAGPAAYDGSTFQSWLLHALGEAQGRLGTQGAAPFQRT
jgi:hypothetical protein